MENPFDEIVQRLQRIEQSQLVMKDQLLALSPADDKTLLTRSEKARELDVSYPTLNRWVEDGLLESIKVGRRVYFRKGITPVHQ